jgi:hypothetical protein
MTLQELLNPWAALRRAELEIRTLHREQVILLRERDDARRTLKAFEARNAKKEAP